MNNQLLFEDRNLEYVCNKTVDAHYKTNNKEYGGVLATIPVRIILQDMDEQSDLRTDMVTRDLTHHQ